MHNILVLFIFLLPIADSSFGVDCDQIRFNMLP